MSEFEFEFEEFGRCMKNKYVNILTFNYLGYGANLSNRVRVNEK